MLKETVGRKYREQQSFNVSALYQKNKVAGNFIFLAYMPYGK